MGKIQYLIQYIQMIYPPTEKQYSMNIYEMQGIAVIKITFFKCKNLLSITSCVITVLEVIDTDRRSKVMNLFETKAVDRFIC